MTKPKLIKLKTPLDDQAVKGLKAGDRVLLTGQIYCARDSAHKLFGKLIPFNIKGAVLFYASPTPTPKGRIIGSIGPTTASRMDSFTPNLLKQGLKATIGKGRRGPEVIAAMKKYQAVYLVVPGGVAASLARHVKKSNVIAYPDLGPEAVLELEVFDFPTIVAVDTKGADLFEQGRKRYQRA
jgi:fumarate hydratase subunit beta